MNDSPWLTEVGAAKYLKIKMLTLRSKRYKGNAPPYIKWGGTIYYDIKDVDDWMNGLKRKAWQSRIRTTGFCTYPRQL